MTNVQRSALVSYTPAEMFALVTDIERYPEFLPWCKSAKILSEEGDEVRASIAISKGAVQKSFTTCNTHEKDKLIAMRLIEGPFSELEGYWRFDALGEEGCKVVLDLNFNFSNPVIAVVVGPVFTQIANTLVDSFEQRAREVYGKR